MTFLYLDGPTQYPERYGFPAHHASPLATIIFFVVIGIAFLLRKNPYLWWIWFVIKCFFIALAAVLIIGRIKSGLKDLLKD